MAVARIATSIADVPAAEWNALGQGGVPFLRHEFLAALESTGRVGGTTGWTPAHVTLRDESNRLIGAVPLYAKAHSWGEFVFDFSWAQAYARYGDAYYPKLIAATPYTPATGPRLLVHPAADAGATRAALARTLVAYAETIGASSVHVQFPTAAEAAELTDLEWLPRLDCQFHWTNPGYADFDDFLATFTAEKRKKAKRERRRVQEAGIRFEIRAGAELDLATWTRVHALHAGTFHRHGHEPYLSLDFFRTVSETLPEALKVVLASRDHEIVATAILFEGADTLYGRYWGAGGDYHSLHFETCYHQGVEYAIRRGLKRFEPGTQGEHKIARGFAPTLTHAAHYIVEPGYRRAIAAFLREERAHIERYHAAASDHTPFKALPDAELVVPDGPT